MTWTIATKLGCSPFKIDCTAAFVDENNLLIYIIIFVIHKVFLFVIVLLSSVKIVIDEIYDGNYSSTKLTLRRALHRIAPYV